MIDALISGVLAADPVAKTTRTGNPYCTCRVRVPMGNEAEALFCLMTAFDATARDSLLALHKGDPVALACSLSITVWTPDSGGARPNVQGTVHAIVSAYHVKHRRAEIANAQRQHEARTEARHANGAPAATPRGGNDFHDDELGDVAF
jgi:single-stranded DNA-binding protein